MTGTTITTEDELRQLLGGEPAPVVREKLATTLVAETRPWIVRSPFVLVGTHDAEGRCDVSPRGDPPGFVRILDDATLLVPERPGNRIADTLRNVIQTGRVALLFVVPGVADTFRVNGRATLTTDAALLAACVVEGKTPKLGILVAIEEAFTHCSKAFLRSSFWDPTTFVARDTLASNGEILRALRTEKGETFDAETYDRERAERYARREGFY